MPGNRASQEQQNGTSFSSVEPSTEEYITAPQMNGQKDPLCVLQNMMPGNRASQELHNGTSFSSVEPSTEEYITAPQMNCQKDPLCVCCSIIIIISTHTESTHTVNISTP